MRFFILLISIGLAACSNVETADQTQQPIIEKYTAPDWSTDSEVATITSLISSQNNPRQILHQTMLNYCERELEAYEAHIRSLDDSIKTQHFHLNQTLAEVNPIDANQVDSLIEYYARQRVQLELLRIQQAHEEELLEIQRSITKLRDSFPHE